MIAAWWTSLLTTSRDLDRNPCATPSMRVLVLDYEAHARGEWRPRVEQFGGDLSKVIIVQPDRPIWDITPLVRELINERDVDYVIVDSALYACAGADAYKPEAATQYSLAIAQFQRPVLTLAHKTKSKDDEGKYPFGSVFWHNGARLTISIDAEGYDDPRVIRTRKANHGADFSRSIDWSWVAGGLPDRLVESDAKVDVVDITMSILPSDGSFMTASAFGAELESRYGIKESNPSRFLNTAKGKTAPIEYGGRGKTGGWRRSDAEGESISEKITAAARKGKP
jgi:hypothetical protein